MKKKPCSSCRGHKGAKTRLRGEISHWRLIVTDVRRERRAALDKAAHRYELAMTANKSFYDKCVEVTKLKAEIRRLKGEPKLKVSDIK